MNYIDWGVMRAFGMNGALVVRHRETGADVTAEARKGHPGGPDEFSAATGPSQMDDIASSILSHAASGVRGLGLAMRLGSRQSSNSWRTSASTPTRSLRPSRPSVRARSPSPSSGGGSRVKSGSWPWSMPPSKTTTRRTCPGLVSFGRSERQSMRDSGSGVTAERAVEWLRSFAKAIVAADLSAERADLVHAVYERIVVAGPRFVSAHLTPAAYERGWPLRCLRLSWRARQDSNLRPSAPEADALSTELQARGRR